MTNQEKLIEAAKLGIVAQRLVLKLTPTMPDEARRAHEWAIEFSEHAIKVAESNEKK